MEMDDFGIEEIFSVDAEMGGEEGVVVVENGKIVCVGSRSDACVRAAMDSTAVPLVLDLEGGSISPGLVSFGSQLGLAEIAMESSTIDGVVFEPLRGEVPSIIDGEIIRAFDGLQFGSRNALYVLSLNNLTNIFKVYCRLAYRAGVTSAITSPSSSGFLSGLSVAFSTSAPNKLAKGAVVKETKPAVNVVGSWWYREESKLKKRQVERKGSMKVAGHVSG